MNQQILKDLYDATEEDLRYGVGTLALPDQGRVPFIHICYGDWPREKLKAVRIAMRSGLDVAVGAPRDGVCDIHISSREQIDIQTIQDGHTSVLRAPAWNAHLEGIDERVVRRFEAERQRHGGFLLLVRTGELEFLAVITDAVGLVGEVE